MYSLNIKDIQKHCLIYLNSLYIADSLLNFKEFDNRLNELQPTCNSSFLGSFVYVILVRMTSLSAVNHDFHSLSTSGHLKRVQGLLQSEPVCDQRLNVNFATGDHFYHRGPTITMKTTTKFLLRANCNNDLILLANQLQQRKTI